jgi:hypothetical protein
MTVNKDRVELFAAALESDRYRQCKGQLRVLTRGHVDFHCALGVATQVALDNGLQEELQTWPREVEAVWRSGALSWQVADWYGWNDTNPWIDIDLGRGEENIASANDAGVSFWDIAQAIRAKYLKDEG